VSTVYEFKTDVKVGDRPGYAWVAAVSFKEVAKNTPPCESEALAKAAPLTEDPKLVWEHWRLFGYKDGRWERLERRMRSTGVFNSEWAEGVADNPILAVEDEFLSYRPK
jgi:hypothetical protein